MIAANLCFWYRLNYVVNLLCNFPDNVNAILHKEIKIVDHNLCNVRVYISINDINDIK